MRFDVTELRERVPIQEYVGKFVKLKRCGKMLKGICPFHDEKTASLTVSPARQAWHCFGCGCGGDVIMFAQKLFRIDFVEAAKMLGGNEIRELPRKELTPENKTWLGAAIDAATLWRRITALQDTKNQCRDLGTADARERWANVNREQRTVLASLHPVIERLDGVWEHEPYWSSMPTVRGVITPDLLPFITSPPRYRQVVLSLIEGR